MNRTDIIKSIAHKESLPTSTVQRVLNTFLDLVALSLSAGDEVALREFGKFEPRARRAVVRRNPKTGEEIPVPEKTSVGFIPSPNLKARLNPDQ